MEKVKVLCGLSLALLGCMFLLDGVYLILMSIVAGLTTLLALMLLFKERFTRGLKRHLTDISENLDVGWLALGLGFFAVGIKCFQIQDQIRIAPLLWLGAIFIIALAVCIAKTLGTSGNKILERNPKVLIILGSIFLIGGLIWFVINWGSLNTNTLLGKLNASAPQLLIVGIGIIYIYLGWKRNKKTDITEKETGKESPTKH